MLLCSSSTRNYTRISKSIISINCIALRFQNSSLLSISFRCCWNGYLYSFSNDYFAYNLQREIRYLIIILYKRPVFITRMKESIASPNIFSEPILRDLSHPSTALLKPGKNRINIGEIMCNRSKGRSGWILKSLQTNHSCTCSSVQQNDYLFIL